VEVIPTATPGQSPSPRGIAVPVTVTATEPPPTPEGTPAPHPSEAVDTGASASFTPPSPRASATPTASPQPGLWRVEGYVVDESGNPQKTFGVAAVRQAGRKTGPHTAAQGHTCLAVPGTRGARTAFDFYSACHGPRTV